MSVSATYWVSPSTSPEIRPIAMPATGRPQGHAGLQQRQGRGADRAHRGGAVGAHRLGELADRVGELLARRQHRQQRAPGERAVADLATLGRAHAAGLTGGERREDVLVHVAARLLRRERVELLLQGQHVQRGDAQDLGLAALEQRRAVHPRDHRDLGGQRADVGEPAAVHADLVAQHALADQRLVQRAERRAELLLAALELRAERVQGGGLDLVEALLALLLAGDGQRRARGRPWRPTRRRRTRRPRSRGRSGSPAPAWRPAWPARPAPRTAA